MTDAHIPDEPVSSGPVTLSGYQRELSSGAKVWMARIPAEHGDGFAMHFTSKGGDVTKLCLSTEAMLALFSLYESLSKTESLTYRLLVKFAEKVGEGATASSVWTRVIPHENKAPDHE